MVEVAVGAMAVLMRGLPNADPGKTRVELKGSK